MSWKSSFVVAVIVVLVGRLGATFIHDDFRYYLLASLVAVLGLAGLAYHWTNCRLAKALLQLPQYEREEHLRELGPTHRRHVEAQLRRLAMRDVKDTSA